MLKCWFRSRYFEKPGISCSFAGLLAWHDYFKLP